MWRRLRVGRWDAARRASFTALALGLAGIGFTAPGAGVAVQEARQEGNAGRLPEIGEGSLLARSPLSGRYEFVPLQQGSLLHLRKIAR